MKGTWRAGPASRAGPVFDGRRWVQERRPSIRMLAVKLLELPVDLRQMLAQCRRRLEKLLADHGEELGLVFQAIGVDRQGKAVAMIVAQAPISPLLVNRSQICPPKLLSLFPQLRLCWLPKRLTSGLRYADRIEIRPKRACSGSRASSQSLRPAAMARSGSSGKFCIP